MLSESDLIDLDQPGFSAAARTKAPLDGAQYLTALSATADAALYRPKTEGRNRVASVV